MKKYTYTIIFILFNLACVYSFIKDDDQEVVSTFNETDEYKIYIVNYENGLSINDYKELFNGINYNDYYIISINLDKEYSNNKLMTEINNIEIDGGNFLASINEYLDKYEKILYLNNYEDDISMIYSGSIKIKRIGIRCREYVYQKITEKWYFCYFLYFFNFY